MQNETKYEPPVAMIKDTVFKEHGIQRVDNYYWLNQREDSSVLDYLNAENEYTKNVMAPTDSLQSKIYKEIVGRIKKDDASVPFFTNGYWYYTRYVKGGEYPLKCRKKETLEAKEEIMLDGNKMAEGKSFFQIGSWEVSPDNKTLMYCTDTVGRRMYTIQFKDLMTGEVYEDYIENNDGSMAWADDNKTIFYATQDPETLRSDRIFRYQLGDVKSKQEIFNETDDTFGTYCYRTLSGKFIVIGSYSTLTSDFKILKANDPLGEFKSFSPRKMGHEYSFSHREGKFYIRSNDQAENFKLMVVEDDKTEIENWKELIPHRPETLLENELVFKHYMILQERTNGLNKISIWNLNTNQQHYIEFAEEAYLASIQSNYNYESTQVRYNYQSMTTPGSVLDYDITTKVSTLKKQTEILGGFDPSNYETKRLYGEARDGTKVPISLVYKKGTKTDGSNPLLLYGYGSYGSTLDPYFSVSRLSLLDRGFVFAIAHVRGSQMLGRSWYEDGKLLKKKNTFYDFIDCGKYLIKEGYSSPDKLFASGGSAGGLLMGAVVNMAPDLFRGVTADVPFVDIMTTMMDASIPLTTGEYDEWGNPNEKEYYEYMLSYSPYDNVVAQDYPNMLVVTALHDSQVQYFEPAKWVAKLRALKTDNNKLLLFTNMDAGHGGASGRYQVYKEIALQYAFYLDLLGIKE
ncbi:MAG: S9 family peptidase [Reichenbachiella sp.]